MLTASFARGQSKLHPVSWLRWCRLAIPCHRRLARHRGRARHQTLGQGLARVQRLAATPAGTQTARPHRILPGGRRRRHHLLPARRTHPPSGAPQQPGCGACALTDRCWRNCSNKSRCTRWRNCCYYGPTRPAAVEHAITSHGLAGAMASAQTTPMDIRLAMMGACYTTSEKSMCKPQYLNGENPRDLVGHKF